MFRAETRRGVNRAFLATAIFTLGATAAIPAGNRVDEQQNRPHVVEESAPVTPTRFDGDVRDLPASPAWHPGDPIREIPRRIYPEPGLSSYVEPDRTDRLAEQQRQVASAGGAEETRGSTTFTTPTRSFSGQGFTGVTPPDPTGAVGPNHYIQAINGSGGALVRIYDKDEPDPRVLATFAMDSLGSNQCASGNGDPIVIYDRHAERWLLSEFAGSGANLCIYISQTSDPVAGGWYNYQFSTPSFPDYPKYGSWPTDSNSGDGSYIVTANDGGPGIYALDRGKMLIGDPATYIRVQISNLPGFGFETPTPADLDGSQLPPDRAPAIIMRHRDTEVHSGPAAPGDVLQMWTFDVDWLNTSNSNLIQRPNIDVSDFDSSLCGLGGSCFPQPGTSIVLDPLREVIMNRLQYMRHFDGTETLVGSYVVDVDGANTGGVRWFELRGGTPGWTVHQEGTYSIDSDNRWMSSLAMDQFKNIALAYNVSSSSVFPSLRYTGREAGDPLGTMTQTESNIFAGTASNNNSRYGDYSHMALDPEDDCTFWFTGETNSTSAWKTQIASFRFLDCLQLGCPNPPDPNLPDSDGDGSVDLCDNCIDLPNAGQEDADLDGVGDLCDCAPDDASVFPDAPMLCDQKNNDCNDPNWPTVSTDEFDDDGDGFAECAGDCDDTSTAASPALTEICNGIDDDCNSAIDDVNGVSDSDLDGVDGVCDNCPGIYNITQADADGDGAGDACDACTDSDADGFGDAGFAANTCPEDNCRFAPNPLQLDTDWVNAQQWAVTAAASSEFSADDYSAMRATGGPQNPGMCVDSVSNWSPLTDVADPEWIELGYAVPYWVTGIGVHESLESGFVYQVDVIDTAGGLHTVWSGNDTTSCGDVFMPTWSPLPTTVDTVVVHTQVAGWEEIDAVELFGLQPVPDGAGDACDVCPGASDPSQVDGDGDGEGDLCDCAPGDALVRRPPAVATLGVDRTGTDVAQLTWDTVSFADSYAIVRGELSDLGFASYGSCLAGGLAVTPYDDGALPAPGTGWFYLIRGESGSCGGGYLGLDSLGRERRNIVETPCP